MAGLCLILYVQPLLVHSKVEEYWELRTANVLFSCDCNTLIESPRREVVRSSAGAGVVLYPLFGGHSRSIPQGMIFDFQPLVKSLFCPMRQSPNGFFDFEASIP